MASAAGVRKFRVGHQTYDSGASFEMPSERQSGGAISPHNPKPSTVVAARSVCKRQAVVSMPKPKAHASQSGVNDDRIRASAQTSRTATGHSVACPKAHVRFETQLHRGLVAKGGLFFLLNSNFRHFLTWTPTVAALLSYVPSRTE